MNLDPPAISSSTMRGQSNDPVAPRRDQPNRASDLAMFTELVLTDKDYGLLEQAAKAAGHNYRSYRERKEPGLFVWLDELSGYYWNPLAENFDAFELAAKLSLTIAFNTEGGAVYVGRYDFNSDVREENAQDICAAARRAIVKAAARVGKGKH